MPAGVSTGWQSVGGLVLNLNVIALNTLSDISYSNRNLITGCCRCACNGNIILAFNLPVPTIVSPTFNVMVPAVLLFPPNLAEIDVTSVSSGRVVVNVMLLRQNFWNLLDNIKDTG